jgi:putative aldouronate transport system substrate-binding protein
MELLIIPNEVLCTPLKQDNKCLNYYRVDIQGCARLWAWISYHKFFSRKGENDMKGKMNTILVLLLVLSIAIMAAACDGGSGTTVGTPSQTTASGGATTSPSEDEPPRDPLTVKMLLMTSGNNPAEMAKVTAAVNQITVEKLNTTVEFTEIAIADFVQKVNLMLSTGEQLDLFQGLFLYQSFYANGYLLPIDDFAPYYADIADLLGPYLDCGKINNVQYSLPNLKDIAADTCIVFRKDLIHESNIDLKTIKNFDQLGDALRILKQKYPEMTPLAGGNQGPALGVALVNFDDNCFIDPMTDDGLGVLMNPTKSSEVTNYYATDSFAQMAQFAWDWTKEGIIAWDQLNGSAEQVRAGTAISYLYAWAPKTIAEASANSGHAMEAWRILPEGNALAGNSFFWNWCVNSDTKEPERVLELLNLMFIDAEINNLLAWGIEGEHYQVVDREKGVIDFLEGHHTGNVPYFQWTKFSLPNNFLQYVLKGDNPDVWKETDEWNKSADVSLAMGFSVDQSKIATQVAVCNNVVEEYRNALLGGLLDPATEIEKFNAALQAGGIEEIIAEKQSQLDAFLAAKGN